MIESVWHKKEIDGFERNYREIIGWGTVVYVFIGLYLLFLLLLKFNMTVAFLYYGFIVFLEPF